jgi:hypothetical protein
MTNPSLNQASTRDLTLLGEKEIFLEQNNSPNWTFSKS